ncbi:MAG: GNAT family N-acetyltransferase [Saprospiraceae bacterium]|nr:GNAT family N-acetyltransferase [Saprospiraceae bacterium]
MKPIIITERLQLREMEAEDAPFMYQLFNSPGWIQFIGDRNIQTIADAKDHILDRYISMYDRFGFGLWLVELKNEQTPIGTCGLIKRPNLDHIDLGFAFLPQFHGHGYAFEAASACLKYGNEELKVEKIIAITIPDNQRSINLLHKLGMQNVGPAGLPDDEVCILFEPRDR